MGKSVGRSKASRAKPSAKGFPKFGKLPLELREKIWEESLALECLDDPPPAPDSSNPLPKPEDCGAIRYVPLSSFQPPASAIACRESRAVAVRLQRKHNDNTLFQREITVPYLHELDTSNTAPLVPLFVNHRYLILSLDTTLAREPGLLSLRGRGTHARRFLDLLLAAKDNQIKIISPERQLFFLPHDLGASCADGWLNKARLLGVKEVSPE